MPSIYTATSYASLILIPVYTDASYTSLTLIYTAATLGLIPICTVASLTSLILVYILAMLGIHILIKGVLKAQRYSFTLLDLVLPTAATLGLIPICIVASLISLIYTYQRRVKGATL